MICCGHEPDSTGRKTPPSEQSGGGVFFAGKRKRDSMKTVEDIAAFIAQHDDMILHLSAVAQLNLPDCWIGAGFVRDAVWDALHGRTPDCARLNDVDIVFLDTADASAERDRMLEARLADLIPDRPWSVKNQARMHTRNGEPPYRDTADAISRWPETATAIAARWRNSRVEILAPHGVDDLVSLIVRPTPAFHSRRAEVLQRIGSKNWRTRWPRLRVEGI